MAAFGASATAADAAKLTLTYQCTYPLIGEAPLSIDIDAAIPDTTPVGVPTAEFKINTIATASGKTYDGISLIGAVKIQGKATANSTVKLPGGTDLPVAVPITVAPYDVPATKQDLVLTATGVTPSLTFPTAGSAEITVDSIALSLKAIKADGTAVVFPGSAEDSDKDVNTFDVTCRLDPATQSTVLTTINITAATPKPSTPAPSTPAPSTPAPSTPAPSTPKPSTPAPSTPAPSTPAPSTPAPSTPAPSTPAPSTPAPSTPAPSTPTPTTPTPTTPDNAKLTLTYQCTYPLIGEAPLKIDIDAAIPASTPVGVPTAEFAINTVATASGKTYDGISLIGASKIEGKATAKSTVTLPGGTELPVSVPITVAPYNVPATKQDLVLNATGVTPSLTFPTAGKATITVDSIALSLKAIKADGTAVVFPGSGEDSDKDVNTFDVTCRLDPATQSTVLRTIDITPSTPVVTTPLPSTPVPTTPVVTTPKPTTPVVTTPVVTTPKPTTPVVTTPVVTTPKPTTPVVTTPVVTTPKPTTPVVTTPVVTTPKPTTPVVTTPVVTTPKPALAPKVLFSLGTGFANLGGLEFVFGSNFKGITSVTVGGKTAGYTAYGSSALLVKLPKLAKGTYPLVITNAAGSSKAIAVKYIKLF